MGTRAAHPFLDIAVLLGVIAAATGGHQVARHRVAAPGHGMQVIPARGCRRIAVKATDLAVCFEVIAQTLEVGGLAPGGERLFNSTVDQRQTQTSRDLDREFAQPGHAASPSTTPRTSIWPVTAAEMRALRRSLSNPIPRAAVS